MVLGSNHVTNDTLNLFGVDCCEVVSTLRFRSPWRVLRAWPWKVLWLSKKKKEDVSQHLLVSWTIIWLSYAWNSYEIWICHFWWICGCWIFLLVNYLSVNILKNFAKNFVSFIANYNIIALLIRWALMVNSFLSHHLIVGSVFFGLKLVN